MRYLFFVFVFIFLGCGGGSGNGAVDEDKTEQADKTPIVKTDIKDRYFPQQWYLAKNDEFYALHGVDENAHIHGEKYYGTYQGRGVKIVVIDDGLDESLEDLNGAITDTFNVEKNSSDVSYTDSHGTMVTGIIGARANDIGIYGLANKSEIVFLKYEYKFSSNQATKIFKKAKEYNPDIINCSFNLNDVSDEEIEIIRDLAKNGRDGKGALVVFSAGNENIISSTESSILEVISVGSTNQYNQKTERSSYGQNLDILAPGGEEGSLGILSLSLEGNVTTNIGTSFAAPIVSGVIAMMLEANPNLTRDEVEDILHKTADKIGDEDYDENGFNFFYGYGKINATKAIEEALRLKN